MAPPGRSIRALFFLVWFRCFAFFSPSSRGCRVGEFAPPGCRAASSSPPSPAAAPSGLCSAASSFGLPFLVLEQKKHTHKHTEESAARVHQKRPERSRIFETRAGHGSGGLKTSPISSTDHLQIMYRLSTDQLQIMYRLSIDQLQIMYRLSTDQLQIIYRSSTDHLQIINR